VFESNRLLKNIHKILLSGVRGEHKSPGEFRKSQNWIGGSGLSDAMFIPPSHVEVPELMSDLEKFWHNTEIEVPHLIRIALSHYQFKTVHPFLDGNGRIGRLLITLYLVSNRLLNKPSLYLSDFFEKNRSSYYDALSRVRESNDIVHWVNFFLNAVITTSHKGIRTFKGILALKNSLDEKIVTLNRKAENGREFVQLLYKKPVINPAELSQHMGIAQSTANELIKDFTRLGILNELTGFKRNRAYIFTNYVQLFL